MLPSAPIRPEGGVHDFLFNFALMLHPWRTEERVNNPPPVCRTMRAACPGNGDRGGNPTIQALTRGMGKRTAIPARSLHVRPCRFPSHNSMPEAFKRFIAGTDKIDAEWLAARSPVCPWNRTPASFLHALYHKGENVIIFDDYRSQGQEVWEHPGLPFDARALDSFAKGKSHGVWFLCNPVDGKFPLNDDGNQSRRSRQSVTSWRFLLLESDRADISASDWLAALVLLPLPIVSICETGGRLAHALLQADAPSKEAWDRIKDVLVPVLTMIGADIGSLSAVRLTRLPCCERLGKEDEHGNYQKHSPTARASSGCFISTPLPTAHPSPSKRRGPMPAPPANPRPLQIL